MTQHFGYAVDRRYLPLLLSFRFKRDSDGVTMGDDTFEATFGFFKATTTWDNITGAHPGPRWRPGRSRLTRRAPGPGAPSRWSGVVTRITYSGKRCGPATSPPG